MVNLSLLGSVNPVEDLENILAAYRSAQSSQVSNLLSIQEVVRSSLQSMESIITQLVSAGGTSAHYRKAVTCVQTFRHACLIDFGSSSDDVIERFNVFLQQQVKDQFKGGRHHAFWTSLVTAGMSLIHAEEVQAMAMAAGGTAGVRAGAGGVSFEQSRQFLLESVAAVVEVAPVVEVAEEEDDDMFGDMA